jgi:hypothetical protein
MWVCVDVGVIGWQNVVGLLERDIFHVPELPLWQIFFFLTPPLPFPSNFR